MQKWIMSGVLTIAVVMAIVLMFTLPGKEQVAEEEKPTMPEVTMDAAAAESTIKAQGCISCHGDQLQGAVGPNLQKIGSQLSAEEIYTIITKGKGGMPSFKDKLKAEEIANVAQWLAEKK
ncbi:MULTISPECIES: c-type cytochrome [Paenibacillus]|jgi:cytochrome c550|uniref:Cytochrome c n=1 Tax=Paenibacillus cineris TaxID=237530 RepID=A0ABQ4LPF2_9BACL|nr:MULTISPECIES: cytochrome c [Paenibacillus]MBJ9993552.1 cytochrome c [Paenibacillus sp. S28]MEC0179672.1 cytochrome c [Paenibacillus favisporus]OXL86594.1 cytochrome C [Paenibacillus sp. SSG-1]UYO05666.1 cytochrome c [Paenibacillus sp. PSB04]GIO58401.1 cytochrome c [Paenibacillus cineris]